MNLGSVEGEMISFLFLLDFFSKAERRKEIKAVSSIQIEKRVFKNAKISISMQKTTFILITDAIIQPKYLLQEKSIFAPVVNVLSPS